MKDVSNVVDTGVMKIMSAPNRQSVNSLELIWQDYSHKMQRKGILYYFILLLTLQLKDESAGCVMAVYTSVILQRDRKRWMKKIILLKLYSLFIILYV